MKALWASVMAVALYSCSSSDVRRAPAAEKLSGRDTVIVIHGYYGSALRETEGPRRFIRIPTILGGKFAIGLESEKLGIRKAPPLLVEGTMERVPVLPGIYGIDVYGNFLKRLERSGRQVLALPYDWRGDLHQAVEALASLVRELRQRGAQRISLAAHSMGGLVAAYYLLYGDQPPETATLNWAGARQTSGVAFFGTPFKGAMSILRNMQHGTGYPWNPAVLEAGTVASFPSSYHLLPFVGLTRFKNEAGEDHFFPLSSLEFWEEHGLGLLHAKDSPQYGARKAYTVLWVRRASLFLEKIHDSGTAPSHLKTFNAIGKGRPTLDSGYFDPKTSELLFLPQDVKARGLPHGPLQSDGDGTVAVESAALPPALSSGAQVLFTEESHEKLFLDPEVEREYANFLEGEEAPGKGG